MAAAEKTVTATEFKATCLDLMAQLQRGELSRVHVTKRGKPLAVVAPDGVIEDEWNPESIFGCMKDFPSPIPPDHDWEKPMYSDEELDGFIQDTVDQIERFRHRPAA